MVTTSTSITETAARLRFAIARTARRLRQEAAAAEPGQTLSPTLTAALATIDHSGPLTPSELAKRERIQRPTATRIVNRLEEAGLIERTADPSDRRACLLATTAEGRALLKRLRNRKNAYIARRLNKLDADELATLERAAGILERMLDDDSGSRPERRP